MTTWARYGLVGLLAVAAVSAADDEQVFFEDGFESGDFSAWSNGDQDFGDPDLRVVGSELAHSGEHALCITARPGQGAGGKLPFWFMPGRDVVHCRWYQRFDTDFDQGNLMHGVHLLGNHVSNKWSAFGKAGIRPNGRDFCSVGFEPWRNWGRYPPPGRMMFYAYYPDMKRDRDGHYWGNMFATEPPRVIERGRWYCFEIRVKLNTPGERDGEMACWVDGEPSGEWTGLRWRDTDEIKLNCFWLLNYVHDSKRDNRIYFDDVVLSETYVGPLEDDDGGLR